MRPLLLAASAVAAFAALVTSHRALGHCEIPCGIYGDQMRFAMWEEAIATIEKSMNEVNRLASAEKPNANQVVRWVQNKEKHSSEIQHIVTQYFMTQRLKPINKDDKKAHSAYIEKLELLHGMLVYAMKAKQTTDLATAEKIRSLLAEFEAQYFGKHEH